MKKCIRRRAVLGAAVAAASAVIAAPAFAFSHISVIRSLSFYNLHTDESLHTAYWADGVYLNDGVAQIEHLLRDFRTDTIHPINRRLLDLLSQLRQRLSTDAPIQVISGYRSPQTNAMLEHETDGVSANSLHMEGEAIDLRVPGRSLSIVHEVALDLQAGGVGYYPHSDFVHVDVGRIRNW
jgi:uncharacterized protein YcbK (DUF882 family)